MNRAEIDYDIFLKCLKPNNYDMLSKEPFDEYRDRVKELLPNWPDCPLENWLYRHYIDAVNRYSWLRFDKIRFTLVSWNNDDIYNKVNSNIIDEIDYLGTQIYTRTENMRSWLQIYFHTNGTWPAPIIIINNEIGYYDEVNFGKPYHLVEGHLRLGYFRNIYIKEKHLLKRQHPLWIVTIDK